MNRGKSILFGNNWRHKIVVAAKGTLWSVSVVVENDLAVVKFRKGMPVSVTNGKHKQPFGIARIDSKSFRKRGRRDWEARICAVLLGKGIRNLVKRHALVRMNMLENNLNFRFNKVSDAP